MSAQVFRRRKDLDPAPQPAVAAFRLADPDSATIAHRSAFTWTNDADACWRELREQAERRSEIRGLRLPTGSLRLYLGAEMQAPVEIDGPNAPRWRQEPIAVSLASADAELPAIHRVLSRFLEGPVTRFVDKWEVSWAPLHRLQKLLDTGNILHVEDRPNPLLWNRNEAGTALPEDTGTYTSLAHLVARTLTGLAPFPRIGPLSPLVQRGRGSVTLLSPPVGLGDAHFALGLEVSVDTIIGSPFPIVRLLPKRTRYMRQASQAPGYGRNAISLHLRPQGQDRVIEAALRWDRRDRTYRFEDEYVEAALAAMGLAGGIRPEDLMNNGIRADGASAFAVYSNTMKGDQDAPTGLMPRDWLDICDAATEPLRQLGLVPLDSEDVRQIKLNGKIPSQDRKMVHVATLFSAEAEAERTPKEILAGLLDTDAAHLRALKPAALEKGMSEEDLAALQATNREMVDAAVGPGTPVQLVIISASMKRAGTLRDYADLLFGDRISIRFTSLPSDVAGSRSPGKSAEDFVAHRQRAWRETIETITEALGSGCFVLAEVPQWNQGTVAGGGTGKPMKDDPLSKVAARMAWARAGHSLQYLNPPAEAGWRGDGEGYGMRVQNAIYDLIFAHNGHAAGIPDRLETFFAPEAAPRYVVGIGVIARSNGGRGQGNREIIAAIRHDTATGRTELAYHCSPSEPNTVRWVPFAVGTRALATETDHTLGKSRVDRQSVKQQFVRAVLDAVVKDDPGALVVIGANGIQWPWLFDKDFSPGGCELAQRPWINAYRTLRIVRHRDTASPRLFQRKGSAYQREASDEIVVVPKHTAGRALYRLRSDQPVYWCTAAPRQSDIPNRARSCLAETLVEPKDRTDVVELSKAAPYDGHVKLPKTVELSVLQWQDGDDPDSIALFLTRARTGYAQYQNWTIRPFVLHFLKTVDDYFTAYEAEE